MSKKRELRYLTWGCDGEVLHGARWKLLGPTGAVLAYFKNLRNDQPFRLVLMLKGSLHRMGPLEQVDREALRGHPVGVLMGQGPCPVSEANDPCLAELARQRRAVFSAWKDDPEPSLRDAEYPVLDLP